MGGGHPYDGRPATTSAYPNGSALTDHRDEAVVVGGGFYGLRVALFLRQRLGFRHVRVFEMLDSVMERASYVNQARVHNGYHYPRSILTAYRSRVNFPGFVDEYRDAVVDDFDHYYAIARAHSKVNARQFELFCTRIGAAWRPAPTPIAAMFHPGRIERSYAVREPAFDARVLRELLLDRISRAGGIDISLGDEVSSIAALPDGRVLLEASSGSYTADRVVGAGYSRINVLHRSSHLEQVALQHEISEMALVELPPALRGLGLTVMDGPFFSVMPFPSRGLHTLSHVRFTPRYRWRDGSGQPALDPQAVFSMADRTSGFTGMRADVIRYVPALAAMRQVDSLREVKTVLAKSDLDDSRPILYRPDHGIANYTCIMGGKLDNIYDVLSELEHDSVSA
ncbi:FAD-dependent oxidoreductase [Angustibacter luteus]|uniref:FAD-dependent oxidoreductase n=1 Tax=Angustibacter luteus TaxID=658456 RepID=A0ABW1JBJ0_9ACTN